MKKNPWDIPPDDEEEPRPSTPAERRRAADMRIKALAGGCQKCDYGWVQNRYGEAERCPCHPAYRPSGTDAP